MVDADQRVRQGFGSKMEPEKVARIQAVDAKHTARMKAIIVEHGWPGRSLVGEDGADAAWLLVQHADASFMAQCMPLMEHAVSAGEASAKDYAYLLDRVRMNQGKPQVYGTQFISRADGKFVLYPVEDAEHVDEAHARSVYGQWQSTRGRFVRFTNDAWPNAAANTGGGLSAFNSGQVK